MRADRGAGCVILSIDDTAVHDQSELSFLISTRPPGSTMKVEWQPGSGGNSILSRVTVGKMYMPPDRYVATKRPPAVGGIRVDYTSTLAGLFANPWRVMPIPHGVAIRELEPKSAADTAGLTVDSIITHVNGERIETPAAFYAVAAAAKGTLRLTIHGRTETIQLDPR
jgi:S1-C subfamily serine protease